MGVGTSFQLKGATRFDCSETKIFGKHADATSLFLAMSRWLMIPYYKKNYSAEPYRAESDQQTEAW